MPPETAHGDGNKWAAFLDTKLGLLETQSTGREIVVDDGQHWPWPGTGSTLRFGTTLVGHPVGLNNVRLMVSSNSAVVSFTSETVNELFV